METIPFILIENWGDEGQIYWAAGHHEEPDFRAAVARFQRGHGLDQLGTEYEQDLKDSDVETRWARFTIPADPAVLGLYVDHPEDSELMCIEWVPEDTAGAFAVTKLEVL